MGLGRHDFRSDSGARQGVAEAFLGCRSGQNPDLLAGEGAEIGRTVAGDEQARPIDERGDRKVDLLAAGEGLRGRLAEKIGLAGRDRVEAVRGGHRHIVDLEIGDLEIVGDMLGD